MKTRKISISNRIFIVTIAMVIITTILVGFVSFMTMRSQVLATTKDQTLRQAENVAKLVNDGVASECITPEQVVDAKEKGEASKYYKNLDSFLSTFLDSGKVKFIYALAKLEDGKFHYILDTDKENPVPYGEEIDTEEEMESAWSGTAAVNKNQTEDEFGTFYTAYAPIKTSNGEVVAIVGLDYDATVLDGTYFSLAINILISVVVAVIIATVISLLFSKTIKRNFKKLDEAINEVAKDNGDLTKRITIKTGDEFEIIATDFNKLLEKTHKTIGEVSNGSNKVKQDVTQINTSMSTSGEQLDELSTTMDSMVISSENISQSIAETKTVTDDVIHNAEHIVEITKENTNQISSSKNNVRELSEVARKATSSIHNNLNEMREQLEVEQEKSKAVEQIHNLSDAILSISDQTNLLALNASIEAARAGEAGRGFAVVASEISSLAADTNAAANEIQQVSTDVMEAIKGLSDVSKKMLDLLGNKVVADYESFAEISGEVSDNTVKMSDNMNELTTVINEFYKSVEKIQTAMEKIKDESESSNHEVNEVNEVLGDLRTLMIEEQETTKATLDAVYGMDDNISKYKV